MADSAVPAERSAPAQPLTLLTALGCAIAAFLFLGAPGLASTGLTQWLPASDPASGWFPAMHLLGTAAILSGGVWLSGVLRDMPRPGLVPLALFVAFQFALLAVAVTNLAIAAGAVRTGGDAIWAGGLYALPAIMALRLHPDLYMSVLRFRSWAHAVTHSDLPPLSGGALVALTVAANLAPLALTFQSLTTHAAAQLAALFRRAVIEPQWYLQTIAEQTSILTAQELSLAAGATALAAALGAIWAAGRTADLRRQKKTDGLFQALSDPQRRFVDDALPAVVSAVNARASQGRFVAWSSFWAFVVAPICLAAAYAAYRWFDLFQAWHALSWVRTPASDFTAFASGEAGLAKIAIPVASMLFVLLMSGPMARAVFRGAKFDQLAFGPAADDALRARLLAAVAAGAYGPGQSFDPVAFAERAARKRYWISLPVVLCAIAVAAWTGFRDLARGVAFTGDGVIVQENYFAPPRLVRYYEVQAAAVDCRISRTGARPVYELSLPGGRVVDMIGSAPLDTMLDNYLATGERLQFSGVGYAYPPGDMEPCLKAIQNEYNSVIAAGTARLLHILD